MDRVAYKQVDVFTEAPFAGNPAGVVSNANGLTDDAMQKIAAELGLPQTAFVMKATETSADFRLRFFSPRVEVDLCGHATLAAFHVLCEDGVIPTGARTAKLVQQTNAGLLPVELHCEEGGKTGRIMMTQLHPTFRDFEPEPEVVAAALGVGVEDFALDKCEIAMASTALMEIVVPISKLATLQGLRPNLAAVEDICRDVGAVSMHCFSFETVSRFSLLHARNFAPGVGIAEDPATGTGNGALGAYLVTKKLVRGTSPVMIVVEQGHSLGRPSEVLVELAFSDTDVTSVRVGGKAVTVAKGEMAMSVGVGQ